MGERPSGGVGMRFDAHLPLIDFRDGPATVRELRAYASSAAELGDDTISGNNHLVWRRPWLDGLAAVAGCTDVTLATTVALPVVRGPAVLAKALATLATLHSGPVIAGPASRL